MDKMGEEWPEIWLKFKGVKAPKYVMPFDVLVEHL